mmetsp:Transcript_7447/g.17998  ORF Transcript_7447/g.17998 Transcript_7447/m.17998 type:complete len:269 (+) Transcript_7447:493-1299(+)
MSELLAWLPSSSPSSLFTSRSNSSTSCSHTLSAPGSACDSSVLGVPAERSAADIWKEPLRVPGCVGRLLAVVRREGPLDRVGWRMRALPPPLCLHPSCCEPCDRSPTPSLPRCWRSMLILLPPSGLVAPTVAGTTPEAVGCRPSPLWSLTPSKTSACCPLACSSRPPLLPCHGAGASPFATAESSMAFSALLPACEDCPFLWLFIGSSCCSTEERPGGVLQGGGFALSALLVWSPCSMDFSRGMLDSRSAKVGLGAGAMFLSACRALQ